MPRIVGDWTRDKLKILSLYLPAYLSATSRALERIYVDAFAGPGKNVLRHSREEIDGSPLIALNARSSNGAQFSRLFFIEQKPKSADELRGHLSNLDTDGRCTVINGEVDEQLPELMRRINKRAPTFVFLDTQGIDPRWTTIQAISPWRVELLINFPWGMSINRNRASPKTQAYFGTTEVRRLLQSPGPSRTRDLIDLYKRRLKDLGFEHPVDQDRLVQTETGKRLYYLIFVSKLDIGARIMEAVYGQPDARGQLRFHL